MLTKLIHFIKYHNAFSILLGILFFSVGSAFAASPTIQETVADVFVAKEEVITKVDNTYIVNLDIETFNPTAEILDITEDDDFYYVKYRIGTVDLKDAVWQEILKENEIAVSKTLLGETDLAVYVMEEVGEVVLREQGYIAEVQKKEQEKGATQKTVATSYRGLVGKFLSATEQVFPGYEPVVEPPPAPAEEPHIAAIIVSASLPSTEAPPPPVQQSEPDPIPPTQTTLSSQVSPPAPELVPTPPVEPLLVETSESPMDSVSSTSTPQTFTPNTDTGTSTPESIYSTPNLETETATSSLESVMGSGTTTIETAPNSPLEIESPTPESTEPPLSETATTTVNI